MSDDKKETTRADVSWVRRESLMALFEFYTATGKRSLAAEVRSFISQRYPLDARERASVESWRIYDDHDRCVGECDTEKKAIREIEVLKSIAPNAIGGRPITYTIVRQVKVFA